MVIWLIGLAGAGKTTVGELIDERLKAINPATVLIDGDRIRQIFQHDKGDAPYTLEGRRQNAERIAELCAWLDEQGINVICCILSLFQDMRDRNRTAYSRYLEVYLEAPMEALRARRSIYDGARNGTIHNVVGVDIPFEPPRNHDMRFNTGSEGKSPEAIAECILAEILSNEE